MNQVDVANMMRYPVYKRLCDYYKNMTDLRNYKNEGKSSRREDIKLSHHEEIKALKWILSEIETEVKRWGTK